MTMPRLQSQPLPMSWPVEALTPFQLPPARRSFRRLREAGAAKTLRTITGKSLTWIYRQLDGDAALPGETLSDLGRRAVETRNAALLAAGRHSLAEIVAAWDCDLIARECPLCPSVESGAQRLPATAAAVVTELVAALTDDETPGQVSSAEARQLLVDARELQRLVDDLVQRLEQRAGEIRQ